MRTYKFLLVSSLLVASSAQAQRFEGIIVAGQAKQTVQKAQVLLLGRRDVIVDSATTDVFGGFSVAAEKPGKYTLLVRRKGYLPLTTEAFQLPEGEVLTDTVFLTGRQAELETKDALQASMRRVFGGGVLGGMMRWLGPDSVATLRERFISLGDLVRTGRLLGLSLPGGSTSSCLRFSGESGCAQLFLDELPVFLFPDQIALADVEAIVPIRSIELGQAATTGRRGDNSRFGVVMIYTNRFYLR